MAYPILAYLKAVIPYHIIYELISNTRKDSLDSQLENYVKTMKLTNQTRMKKIAKQRR